MSLSPPLRFLAMVLGGWAAMRSAIVAPPWSTPPADAAAAEPRSRSAAPAPPPRQAIPPIVPPRHAASQVGPARTAPPIVPRRPHSRPAAARIPAMPQPAIGVRGVRLAAPIQSLAPRPLLPPPHQGSGPDAARRWSLSAWSFVRQGRTATLAAGGLLGGSQAGARLAYRLNGDRTRPLALSARLSAPLRDAAGAEAAFGLDWRPSRRVPVHLLVERRQALGREGRSAFGLTAHGGVSDVPLGRLRIDAYVQAGLVGARSRDPFGDGSIRLSLPVSGRLRLGAGAWAAAQPGVSRLDLGPQAALRVPVSGRAVTLAADWRLRAAGNAEPGSGPTLTVATDF